MSRFIFAVFVLSLIAFALSLAGVWRAAGILGEALLGLTLVLVLLSIVNHNDQSPR